MFVLPLLILISTYVCTVITIARSERQFRAEVASGDALVASDVNRRRLIHRAKMKSLRISVVIVVAFIVWWTPYYTMMIIYMFLDPDEHLSEELQSSIFFFGMSNSLVNPVIYGAFHLWQPKNKKSSSISYSENKQRSGVELQRCATFSNSRTRINIDPQRDKCLTLSKNQTFTCGNETTSVPELDATENKQLSVNLLMSYNKVVTLDSHCKTSI